METQTLCALIASLILVSAVSACVTAELERSWVVTCVRVPDVQDTMICRTKEVDLVEDGQ